MDDRVKEEVGATEVSTAPPVERYAQASTTSAVDAVGAAAHDRHGDAARDGDDQKQETREFGERPAGRGAGQDDGDDDDQDEDDDDEEEEEDAGDGHDHDNDEDDDEEEDEEEDDDDDDDEGSSRRRAKKQRRNRFLDVEAEVDNDDEDVEDEEAEELLREDGFIADDLLDESRDELRSATDNQRLDRFRRQEEELSAEALAEELRQRHARNNRYSSQSDYAEVPQRMLMPSVDDPGLWRIRCKRGREQHLVATVMRRALAHEAAGKPLKILSAFSRDSLEGQLFVEARRADDVISAFEGLAGAYVTNTKPFLVPILEMADLLKLQKKQAEIPVGGWVRVKRGKYAGDLAQVLDVAENGEEVGLKLVPRIDLNPSEQQTYTDRAGRKRKKPVNAALTAAGFRPPQRLFNPEEVQKAYPHELPTKRGGAWVFAGETFRDGYLEKDFRVTALSTDDVNPSLDEVLRFTGEAPTGNDSNVDLNLLASASKRGLEDTLQPGDHVEVFDGEQAGVHGVVDSLDGEVVVIESADAALNGQKIEVPARSVRKQFKPGDHVKVLAGKHADETGLVVKVEGGVTTFLSDLSQSEVSVFSKDIREAAEVGSGVNVIGEYELHNLVQLDPQTAGVIFKIERESFRVLDQNGEAVTVRPHQISMRRDSARAVAIDHDGNEIRDGDMVKEVEWPLSQFRSGQVLHIYQSTLLFLHNREYTENGGVFVVRARNVEPLAPTANKGVDTTKMNPAVTGAQGAQGGSGAIAAPRRGGRDIYAGKHVAIIRGPYKTYRGIIKETTGGTARVELHTTSKILTVPLDHMVEKNPMTGESRRLVGPGAGAGFGGFSGGMAPPPNPYGGATPAAHFGGRTPAYNPFDGGRTPGYGGRTPAYGGGFGQTPNPYASATPNPYAAATPNPYMGQTPNPYAATTPNPYMGQTPNPYAAATPNPYMGQTPNPYAAATPNPYAAATPNPYGGATPNPYGQQAPATVVEGIRARILPNSGYQRGAYDGASGRISFVANSACTVTLDSGAVLTDVPTKSVEPLRPTGSDEECLVIEGIYSGSKVTVKSLDGMICEVSMGDQIIKVPLRLLALI
ncbi:transcription elongation factor spt5 [Malassezia cuniculi]|uniref:Transcription elongation factor SPT5 n=1 Tax=Malassezia cuniculi TaxID=948313 RepID=A0AAF0EQ94_9BASI|nr:transcription elongation factor spt5 [Malassezia cuniculi]